MKISQLAIAGFALTIMSSVVTMNAAGIPPDAPTAQGAAAAQVNPELLQEAKSAAENGGAQKQTRKRAQVKQGSPPADIHALHPKSR